jgi:hypothetical protein
MLTDPALCCQNQLAFRPLLDLLSLLPLRAAARDLRLGSGAGFIAIDTGGLLRLSGLEARRFEYEERGRGREPVVGECEAAE